MCEDFHQKKITDCFVSKKEAMTPVQYAGQICFMEMRNKTCIETLSTLSKPGILTENFFLIFKHTVIKLTFKIV